MALASRIIPWSGVAYRHLPSVVRKPDVLDYSYAGQAADNRWNLKGERTLYLAGDVGVAVAEWARHFTQNTNPTLEHIGVRRTVWRLTLSVDHVLDLRDKRVWDDLYLADAPNCFLDVDYARAVAGFVRHTTPTQGLIVPSIAMLDKLDRWCLVLFLDKLADDPRRFITHVRHAGYLTAPHGVAKS